MNIIHKGQFLEVDNNQPCCNNMTQMCDKPCDDAEQLKLPKKERCFYHKPPKNTNQHHMLYRTVDEKKFLDGLGAHSTHVSLKRDELLKRYIPTMLDRSLLGKLDRLECIEYAHQLKSE